MKNVSRFWNFLIQSEIRIRNTRCFTEDNTEYILEKLTMQRRPDQWVETRHKHLVYEDHFNPSVVSMANKKGVFGFDKLIQLCKKYEICAQIDDHGIVSQESYSTFIKAMPSVNNAKAAAFYIAFYIGSQSGGISRGASIIARQSREILNFF